MRVLTLMRASPRFAAFSIAVLYAQQELRESQLRMNWRLIETLEPTHCLTTASLEPQRSVALKSCRVDCDDIAAFQNDVL